MTPLISSNDGIETLNSGDLMQNLEPWAILAGQLGAIIEETRKSHPELSERVDSWEAPLLNVMAGMPDEEIDRAYRVLRAGKPGPDSSAVSEEYERRHHYE
jgi:hypothetical protein